MLRPKDKLTALFKWYLCVYFMFFLVTYHTLNSFVPKLDEELNELLIEILMGR